MPHRSAAERTATIASRVSTVELLLDLVFVFIFGEIAQTVVADPGWSSVLRAGLVLGIVWWMYDAFAWVTNQAVPDSTRVRLALFAAMAAFLVMALAVPDVTNGSAVTFGAAYLVVVVIHAGLFINAGGRDAARILLPAATGNAAAGLCVLATAFVDGAWDWVLLVVPYAFFAADISVTLRRGGFALGSSHFVERHGLFMIIALGESILSVGAGLTGHGVDLSLAVAAVATVAVVAVLWWSHFTGDDERADEVLGARSPRRRTLTALSAFYAEFVVMLFGLVLLAAGLNLMLHDVTHTPGAPATWLVAGGVAVFFVASALYRLDLALGAWRGRLLLAAASAALGGVGLVAPAIVELGALVLVAAAFLAVEEKAA